MNLLETCTRCLTANLPAFQTSIKVKAHLTAGQTYYWQLTDKFGNKYTNSTIADTDGNITISDAIRFAGLFTPGSTGFEVEIYNDENLTAPVDLTFCDETKYTCIQLSFYSTGCDTEAVIGNCKG